MTPSTRFRLVTLVGNRCKTTSYSETQTDRRKAWRAAELMTRMGGRAFLSPIRGYQYQRPKGKSEPR